MQRYRPAIFLTLFWAGATVGCSPEIKPCEAFDRGGVGFVAPDEKIASEVTHVGEPVTVSLNFQESFSGGCGAPTTTTTPTDPTFELKVFDPLNQPVLATLSEGSFGSERRVTFSPERPGNYHVSLRRSPDGALVQKDLVVAIDRRSSPRFVMLNPCDATNSVAVTQAGAAVCDREAERGGQSLGLLSPGEVRAVDDVLWSIGTATLARVVDDGMALTASPAQVQLVGIFHSASVTADEALILRNGWVDRYRMAEGGSLIKTGTATATTTDQAAVHRVGDVAFTLEAEREEFFGNGVESTVALLSCAFELPSDGSVKRTEHPCQRLQGGLIGASHEAIWTLAVPLAPGNPPSTPMILRRYALSGTQLTASATLVVPSSVAIAAESSFAIIPELLAPTVRAQNTPQWLLAREHEGEIQLERFSSSPDFRAATVGALWMVGKSLGSSRELILVRP